MKRSLYYAMLLTGACLALAAITLTLSGCSTLAKAVNIENPRYSIRNLRPRVDIALPLSASSIDFDFTLGVDNPNSVGLKLSGVDFDLFVNGNQLLRSNTTQNVSIPARGFGEVNLRSRVDYQAIRNIWREMADVIQGNRAKYELRGNAYYDTPIGRMTFPVTVLLQRLEQPEPMSSPVVEVCSREEAGAILSATDSDVSFLISIGEEKDGFPAGYDNVQEKLRLAFADSYDGSGAKEHDVQRIIDAARSLATRPGRILIHCTMGISRSSAAAFIIHSVLLGPGREGEALARVVEQRPIARPNRRMLEIADRLLDRGGAMTAALDALQGTR